MTSINYLNLGTQEVIDYLCSQERSYSYSDTKYPAQYSRDRKSNEKIELFCYEREYYTVYEKSTEVSKLDFVIPIKHTLNVTVKCNLFIKYWVTPDDNNKIVSAFNSYTNVDGDIGDYIKSKLTNGLNEDMFILSHSFDLYKLNVVRITQQRDEVIDTVRHKFIVNGNIDIIGNDATLSSYYSNNEIEVRLRNPIEQIKGLPQIKLKDPHEVAVPSIAVASPVNVIEKLLENDIDNMGNMDCTISAINRIEERIASTFDYPNGEIRTELKEFTLIDNCGITITWSCDMPQFKKVRQALYVYVGKSDNLKQVIIDQVKNCAIKAGLAGAVIAIVFENFEAGLIAFKAIFTECIKYMAKEDAKCLIPNVALLTEEVGWYWFL